MEECHLVRFARAFTFNGNLVCVLEQEVPFEPQQGVLVDGVPLDGHDIGLVEDFEPTDPENGDARCTPARHLFARMESSGGTVRVKPGHSLPPIIDCPCTLEGIRDRVRAKGPAGVPTKARAWLTLLLPPDEVRALGIGDDIPVSALIALESMRVRRDPRGGSRVGLLERQAQRASDERTRLHLLKTRPQEE